MTEVSSWQQFTLSTSRQWEVVVQSTAGNTFEADASRGAVRHPRHAVPWTEECFSISARRGMFRPYCA